MVKEDTDCVRNDTVGASVVVAKATHPEGCVQVIMEEAGHHGSFLGG